MPGIREGYDSSRSDDRCVELGIFQGVVVREFVFTLSYEPGVDPLVDAFIDHPEVTAQSTTCVATADHMWRVDTLFGPEDALDRIETCFLDESRCNECHGHGCDTERRYEVLERAPTHRIVYTHRREIRGCHSIPYLAVEHVGSGVLFETERTGDTYEWTVLMPDDEGVGRLYDAIGGGLREGVGLDLQHVTGHQGWRSGALAAPRLSHAQREAVRAAVAHGYYETPRECTVTELSDRLDVARSTLQYRLQRAESQLLAAFVERLP
jgi:predicted DNA binding protein